MERKQNTDPKSFKPFGTFSTNSFNIRASTSNSKTKLTPNKKSTPVSKTDSKLVSGRQSHAASLLISNNMRFSIPGSENPFCSKLGGHSLGTSSLKKDDYLFSSGKTINDVGMLKTPDNNSKRRASEVFSAREENFYTSTDIKEENTYQESTQILFDTSNNYTRHDVISVQHSKSKDTEYEKILLKIEKGIGESEVVKVRVCFMNTLAKCKDTKKLARFLRQRGATPSEMMIYNDLYSNDMTLSELKTTILLNPESSHSLISTTLKDVRRELGVKKSLMRRGSKIMLIEKETPIIEAGNISDLSVDEEDSITSTSSKMRCHCIGKNVIENPSSQEEELCYESIPRKVTKYQSLLVEKLMAGTTSYLIEDYFDLEMSRIYIFFVRRTRTWGFYFIPKISHNIWDLYVPVLLEKEDGSLIEFSLNPSNELSSASYELLDAYNQMTRKNQEKNQLDKSKEIDAIRKEIETNEREWSKGYGILSILHPIEYFNNMVHRHFLQKRIEKLLK